MRTPWHTSIRSLRGVSDVSGYVPQMVLRLEHWLNRDLEWQRSDTVFGDEGACHKGARSGACLTIGVRRCMVQIMGVTKCLAGTMVAWESMKMRGMPGYTEVA